MIVYISGVHNDTIANAKRALELISSYYIYRNVDIRNEGIIICGMYNSDEINKYITVLYELTYNKNVEVFL